MIENTKKGKVKLLCHLLLLPDIITLSTLVNLLRDFLSIINIHIWVFIEESHCVDC